MSHFANSFIAKRMRICSKSRVERHGNLRFPSVKPKRSSDSTASDRLSRDPDDNVFLSTARAGKAKYLVTNDRDLLDLPQYLQKTLPFAILTPYHFLKQLEGE
jgi:predicted nucleic acid-binding protein